MRLIFVTKLWLHNSVGASIVGFARMTRETVKDGLQGLPEEAVGTGVLFATPMPCGKAECPWNVPLWWVPHRAEGKCYPNIPL